MLCFIVMQCVVESHRAEESMAEASKAEAFRANFLEVVKSRAGDGSVRNDFAVAEIEGSGIFENLPVVPGHLKSRNI